MTIAQKKIKSCKTAAHKDPNTNAVINAKLCVDFAMIHAAIVLNPKHKIYSIHLSPYCPQNFK